MSPCLTSSDAASLCVLLLLCLLLPDAAAEWVETAKLVDSDGEESDHFGYSVAMDNRTIVVGAYRDNLGGATWAGSVTIFESSDGEWVAHQKLEASDAEAFDEFGWAVAISNGVVAVGAPFEDDGGDRAGAVYIYGKGAEGVWTEKQKLVHSDAAAGDWFGFSLAMQGNTLLVGANGDDSDRGSVYVYTLLASALWTQATKLTARDRILGDNFGSSVAIDVDTILIGAPFDDDLGANSGSAYIFQRDSEGGSWTQVEKLTPSDGQSRDQFGRSVALQGGTIFVGSFNNADGENVGAVYQFGKEGSGTWTQQNKLVERGFTANYRFGRGLAFRDGTLVVGARGQHSNTGAVYVFEELSGGWTEQGRLVAGDGAADDRFGYAVGIDDVTVIAAAYGDNLEQGSVYAFEWRLSEPPSIMPSIATPAAPIATQNSGLQPIVTVVFVGVAFLAGVVFAVLIYSRKNNRAAVPNQDTPHNDHRVVITDDISELEEPSLGKGALSVESSAVTMVHTLGVGTASIGHSQQTSLR